MDLTKKSKRINLTCLVIIGLIVSLSFSISSATAQKRQFLSVGTAPPGGAFSSSVAQSRRSSVRIQVT